jgi:FKBP-type peptidyl-prolyl cis-trans isomerase
VGDTIAVQYIGYFEDGRVFDTSLKGEKKPFVFKLGAGQVIAGWDIGLQDMKQGAMRRLYVSAALAYGVRGVGNTIPPNTNLIFDVQLITIQ